MAGFQPRVRQRKCRDATPLRRAMGNATLLIEYGEDRETANGTATKQFGPEHCIAHRCASVRAACSHSNRHDFNPDLLAFKKPGRDEL
jgi:hypothetical protein